MNQEQNSQEQLEAVAAKLAQSILSMTAEAEYGTEGRETMGGTIMAGLARALVAVRAEHRAASKTLNPEPGNLGKIVMMAPKIPTKKGA